MKIYIQGSGGLGNCIFHIATGIYYAEKYNGKIFLIDNYVLHIGTSTYGNRNNAKKDANGNIVSYKTTIFNNPNLNWIQGNQCNQITAVINNDYTDYKIVPKNDEKILIQGFNQNINLFSDVLDKIPFYLNLTEQTIYDYLKGKYKFAKKNIMIGIRVGDDFSHMKKITPKSYKKAIEHLTKDIDNDYKLVLIADVKERISSELLSYVEPEKILIIDEDDITQFYAGLLCDDFILSESTYHYWIALLKWTQNKNSKVIVYNDTDLTNRNLSLPEWIKLDY